MSSSVLWVKELVWWCCASELVHWWDSRPFKAREKNNESFIHFLRKMIVYLLISWHYAFGIKVLIKCYHKQSVFHYFHSSELENIFIIISDHCYYESKSWKYVAYVVFFLSQDICQIKIESEVSICFVNLYWNRKKIWLS